MVKAISLFALLSSLGLLTTGCASAQPSVEGGEVRRLPLATALRLAADSSATYRERMAALETLVTYVEPDLSRTPDFPVRLAYAPSARTRSYDSVDAAASDRPSPEETLRVLEALERIGSSGTDDDVARAAAFFHNELRKRASLRRRIRIGCLPAGRLDSEWVQAVLEDSRTLRALLLTHVRGEAVEAIGAVPADSATCSILYNRLPDPLRRALEAEEAKVMIRYFRVGDHFLVLRSPIPRPGPRMTTGPSLLISFDPQLRFLGAAGWF